MQIPCYGIYKFCWVALVEVSTGFRIEILRVVYKSNHRSRPQCIDHNCLDVLLMLMFGMLELWITA
jgi:hypothetical protein